MPHVVVLLAPLIALLPLAWLMMRDARRLWRSVRLIQRGRYAESRTIHRQIGRSWMRIFPSVRQASRYGIALTLHMEGDFERALEELAQIERTKLDRDLTYAVASLEGTCLVLERRELAHAEKLLEAALAIHQPPEDLLCLAHARLGLGDPDAAEALLTKASEARRGAPLQMGRTVLIEDPVHHDAVFHAMRGLLLAALGREAEALADYERAASVPLQNWYTERARALLPSAATADLEPRSSLAPTVSET